MRATYSYFWRIGAIRLGASALLCAVLGNTVSAQIVYPAPPLVIQDVQWSSGTHHYSQSPAIVAPDAPGHPVEVSGTADAEFVSGTAVHLTDGFQAGSFTGDGQFRARIGDQYGDPESIVLIPSEPGAQIVDGVVHVPKWEKLEIGIALPQAYKDAIDRFFENYYSNGYDQPVTPGNVNVLHDLNPYADDSLRLVMTLTDPSGAQTMKWGFYMKEAKWESDATLARMVDDPDDPRNPYHVRFRVSPNTEGVWHFGLALSAPHTQTLAGNPLPSLQFNGFSFVCDPALADNHGFLSVATANRQNLQFDDGTPFFGLGPNMADQRRGNIGVWHTFYRHDFNKMQESMEMLHDVGGNFLRLFLFKNSFAPEWVNLGVYDHFVVPPVCSVSESATDPNCDMGWMTNYRSSGQHHSWAFDSMLTKAREEGLYIQLCLDPHMPTTAFEKFLWGDNPLVIHFLDPIREPGSPYDMKEYFYQNGDAANTDEGVFYYWKRRFKYMLSRWGYSVNLAIYEPFNEMSQMLTYEDKDLRTGLPPVTGCNTQELEQRPNREICPENRILWERDPDLPGTVDQWITDIAEFVRGNVDFNDPAESPMGEQGKLFLLSYAGVPDPLPAEHFLPLRNKNVDLLDIHQYANPNIGEVNWIDWRINVAFDVAQHFRNTYQSQNAQGNYYKKPFSHGEMNYSTNINFAGDGHEIEKMFHNYDVSFHNEIWSSAFSGKFAAGTSWHWERVFWWDDALATPPDDELDQNYLINNPTGYSNVDGFDNVLNVGGIPTPVRNRKLHHHYKPLADLLAHPSWLPYQFFTSDYTAHEFFDNTHTNELECYYLKNEDDNLAIGWVHNRNAWVMRNFYLASSVENFLGCDAPNAESDVLTLTGFAPSANFYITWFATRMNSTVHPPHSVSPIQSSNTGEIIIDLTGQFGGIDNGYLDTLRSDYAFIVSPAPFPKSRSQPVTNTGMIPSLWDFSIYPNPASGSVTLDFQDDGPRLVDILDVSGRLAYKQFITSARSCVISIEPLAKGIYWVRVANGAFSKSKKLIIH